MKDYQPPFTITNEILAYVSSISEKVGRITATVNMESKPHLRKNNRIKSIHSSLRIEANSLSLGQVRDVINGKTVLGEQKEIQEVKNAYAAYDKLTGINPPYTAAALLGKLGLKSKETFRKHYLHPAIKLSLVRMTIPEKPNSKNQRYIKL